MDGKEDAGHATDLALLRRGFLAMLPLWSGALPTGAAFALAARSTGMSPAEVQLASLSIFSAGAQIGALTLGVRASYLEYALVGLTTNLQLVVLGFTAGHTGSMSFRQRLVTAALLTDGAFAIAAREPTLRWQVLVGAGFGMYLGWNLGTALGLLGGAALPPSADRLIQLVMPLAFVAILVPLLRTAPKFATALAAALTCLALRDLPIGLSLTLAALVGCLVGDWFERGVWRTRPMQPTENTR